MELEAENGQRKILFIVGVPPSEVKKQQPTNTTDLVGDMTNGSLSTCKCNTNATTNKTFTSLIPRNLQLGSLKLLQDRVKNTNGV